MAEAINDNDNKTPMRNAAGSMRDEGPRARPAHAYVVPLPDAAVDWNDPLQRNNVLLGCMSAPAGASQLLLLAMHAVAHATGESWFGAEQSKGICTLMTKNSLGVKIHGVPRRRWYDHACHHFCNHLMLMMSEDGSVKASDDGDDKINKDEMHDGRVGLTFLSKRRTQRT